MLCGIGVSLALWGIIYLIIIIGPSDHPKFKSRKDQHRLVPSSWKPSQGKPR